MKEKIFDTVISLFKVKTLITLATSILFITLAYNEKIPIETTTMVIGMVFTYYFNKDNNNI